MERERIAANREPLNVLERGATPVGRARVCGGIGATNAIDQDLGMVTDGFTIGTTFRGRTGSPLRMTVALGHKRIAAEKDMGGLLAVCEVAPLASSWACERSLRG